MLKSILTQIWNRKQNNSWITIELVLVFCLIWYMTDYFFVLTYNYSIPNYRNIDHTFLIKLGKYDPDNSEYNEKEDEEKAKEANFERVLQTIQSYPGIESLSISFYGSVPEAGSYSGTICANPNDTTAGYADSMDKYINTNFDFFRVFGYTTNNGKKQVSMHDFDWSQPNGVVISSSIEQQLYGKNSALGKEIKKGKELYKIVGVVDNTKRFDYQRPQHAIYTALPLSDYDTESTEIAVRSNSTYSDVIFRENLEKELNSKFPIGNFYLKNITSFKYISSQTKTIFGMVYEIQIRIYLMLFFLVNIILCIVGTFWYRVNTRREEIGIRKALGSSSSSIRNNLILEGLCLLTIATLPAMIISYQFVHAGLIETLGATRKNPTIYLPDRTFLRSLITNAITWIIIAAVVIAAVWLPARKAAAMEAAEALHYE